MLKGETRILSSNILKSYIIVPAHNLPSVGTFGSLMMCTCQTLYTRDWLLMVLVGVRLGQYSLTSCLAARDRCSGTTDG